MSEQKKSIIENVLDSLHNGPGGYSLRKELAVLFSITEIIVLIKYTDQSNIVGVLGLLIGQVLALAGLYTWGNIKEKQNESK